MIKGEWMAAFLENGLNAVNDIENTEFVVMPDLGEYKISTRQRNTVTNYINCILTTSPQANDTANGGLVIAIDQFALRVIVPTEKIRTTPGEDPISYEDDVYKYVEHIKSLVDEMFAVNKTGSMEVGGKTYSLGYTYSMSATGDRQLITQIGDCIDFTVNIAVTIVQSGVNSMDVVVTVDGKRVPYQSATPNRSVQQTNNVFSDDTEMKTIVLSSAFAMDMAAPAIQDMSSAGKWLLDGKTNEAHFVGITYGSATKYYLLTFMNARGQSEGVTNVGENYAFAESPNIPDLLAFPEEYNVSATAFSAPTGELQVNIPSDGTYICLLPDGSIKEYAAGTSFTAEVPEKGMLYDEDGYYAYVVMCKLEADNA